MYITPPGFGQTTLTSFRKTPCVGDKTVQHIECAILNDAIEKTLNEFHFGKHTPRTWHRRWIKNTLVPKIISMSKNKPIKTIVAIGHADEAGEAATNYKIGKARANAIINEIKLQIARSDPSIGKNIIFKSLSSGECYPEFMDKKRDRRNRRVHIFVISAACRQTTNPTDRARKSTTKENKGTYPLTTNRVSGQQCKQAFPCDGFTCELIHSTPTQCQYAKTLTTE